MKKNMNHLLSMLLSGAVVTSLAANGLAMEWQGDFSVGNGRSRQTMKQAEQTALQALSKSGVQAKVEGGKLNVSGSGDRQQLCTALFDDIAKVADFLGGPVSFRLVLPKGTGEFTLNLEARNTTGYIWEVTSDNGSLRKRGDGKTDFAPRYRAYGAPAIQTFTFTRPQDAPLEIQLVYHRPFEPSAPAKGSLTLTVDEGVSELGIMDPTPRQPDGTDATPVKEAAEDVYAQLDTTKALPTSWDWRSEGIVPTVRDQGSCGACWSFGTVGIMESAMRKAGESMQNLSEQFLVNCNTDGWGCDGGLTANKYHYNVLGRSQSAVGAVLESTLPYVEAEQSCSVAYAHPYRLNSWEFVTGSEWTVPTVTQIKNAIYTYGPITAGVCADSGWYSYSGGVYAPTSNQCWGYTNHQIILVGWNDSTQSWILRNTWGTSWGESGYMRIRWDEGGTTSRVGEGTSWVKYTESSTSGSTKGSIVPIIPLLLKHE